MNVLITGGMGFIGSSLAHYLSDRGDKLTIMSKSLAKAHNVRGMTNVKVVIKDINDISPDDFNGIDVVYHCASTVDNYNVLTNPKLDFVVNCQGTISLLEAMKNKMKDIRLVYVSTFFVNGNPESLPVKESDREHPLGLYGISKLATEQILDVYGKVHGLNYSIARLTNVYGIGEQVDNNKKAAFNRILWDISNGRDVNIYDGGKIYRDYIYIDDVVSALTCIANTGESGELYFVGSGVASNFGDMVNHAIKTAKGLSGKMIAVNPPKFHKDVGISDFYCDNSKLKSLGWECSVGTYEGIEKIVDHYITLRLNDK